MPATSLTTMKKASCSISVPEIGAPVGGVIVTLTASGCGLVGPAGGGGGGGAPAPARPPPAAGRAQPSRRRIDHSGLERLRVRDPRGDPGQAQGGGGVALRAATLAG